MNENKEVIILHISDLHRTPGAELSNEDLWGTLRNDIWNTYAETALGPEEPQLPMPKEIDLIVVSGDITQTADPKEYTEAKQFLTTLATKLLDGDKGRLIIVPGNHDVRWSHSRGAYAQAHDIDEKKLKEAYARESRYRLEKPLKSLQYVLWERTDEDLYKKRFEPFANFFSRFYGNTRSFPLKDTNTQWTVFDSFTKDLNVVLVGFNSCFFVDHLWHQGAIQREAILKASEELDRRGHRRQGGPLRIGVWHHNVLGSPQQQDFMDPQTAVLLAQHGFSLGLHGHVHQSGRFEALGSQASLPVVWAGSICAGSKERPQSIPLLYNVIGVNPSLRKGWVHTRSREKENDGWSSYNNWSFYNKGGRRKKRCWYPLNLSLTSADQNIVELQQRIKTLTKENDDFRSKLQRYVSKVFPTKRPPVHMLIDAAMVYRCCNDNGDCAGTLKLTISPSGEDP
ncbi:MAG: metallophosphoesterase, partial [Nitrososphaera sp.]|nr:metallophosphoesterase [Nitrososphaera sp.]